MEHTDCFVHLQDIRVYFYLRRRLFRSTPLRAVDGVSLCLPRGTTLALVGESGSGKSTLGRASLRLLRPTGGRVIVDGTDITNVPDSRLKDFRRRAQAIFQDPYSSLDSFMSIREILEEPLVVHGLGSQRERRDRALKALEDVRLVPPEQYISLYPHILSGGQRQRIGIARALMLGPDYIVADEPVSMIDASQRVEILSLMRELQAARGLTFLYITHDIATARYFSDRIAVMYRGKVVEMGHPDEVLQRPVHAFTRALIAAVPEPNPQNRFRERPTLTEEIGPIPPLVEVSPGHFVAEQVSETL